MKFTGCKNPHDARVHILKKLTDCKIARCKATQCRNSLCRYITIIHTKHENQVKRYIAIKLYYDYSTLTRSFKYGMCMIMPHPRTAPCLWADARAKASGRMQRSHICQLQINILTFVLQFTFVTHCMTLTAEVTSRFTNMTPDAIHVDA